MDDRPLRIGIACYPTHGGSGVLATELGIALARSGHEVHFLAYSRPPRLSRYHPRIFCHLVEVSTYPLHVFPPYDLALAARMSEVVVERELDVLHVHYAVPHSISAYLARQVLGGSPVAIVTTLHGTDITLVGKDRAYREVVRFGIEQSDAVIAVSDYLRRETIRLFECRRALEVIPNFVDTERYRPRAERDRDVLGIRDRDFLAVHVSNFRPVKRAADTVRAFSAPAREGGATLVMVGDGPDREACALLAAELEIADCVRFLGAVDDVSDLLPLADVLISTSEAESFGLAALEAHACGLPVVGYDVGGMSEVVAQGRTGYLVRFGDLPALSTQLASLRSDIDLRTRLSAAARKRAVEEFDIRSVLARHEQLYRRAIDERSDHK